MGTPSPQRIAKTIINPFASQAEAGVKAGKKIAEPDLPGITDIETPGESDEEVQQAVAEERRQLRLKRGRRSTILTGLREQFGDQGKTKVGQ